MHKFVTYDAQKQTERVVNKSFQPEFLSSLWSSLKSNLRLAFYYKVPSSESCTKSNGELNNLYNEG